ncbi:DUF1295 domain-containing protein [Saccharopolyspora sp. 6V]|uniref:DUF1295 domain-containing protein n=1 Tax=Saccharopolyspora sp. 6V TaxID=2877239 RepID=UPI001CD3C9E1|nr:DUF1295 domain-containing protein [Saccharopolyspora sp. 6V]MCA1196046.1 DUF1295 domain-containing protein [Saccharopolyspora sp. 6V]
MNAFLTAPAAALATVLAAYGVARLRKRYDTIDSVWGAGFAVIALCCAFTGPGSAAGWTATALTVGWGVRLSAHLHHRNSGGAEDPRYLEMARRYGDRVGLLMFLRVYLVQGIVMWFVSLPVQAAIAFPGELGALGWAGIVVWVIGFGFETVGDAQLSRFRADPANSGRVLDSGLWRYTRHPNYFGDACVWWGLYLLACHSWAGAATLLSPLVMTWDLARATGQPLLERGMRERRPGYADYVERTSGFLPRPPRRG